MGRALEVGRDFKYICRSGGEPPHKAQCKLSTVVANKAGEGGDEAALIPSSASQCPPLTRICVLH